MTTNLSKISFKKLIDSEKGGGGVINIDQYFKREGGGGLAPCYNTQIGLTFQVTKCMKEGGGEGGFLEYLSSFPKSCYFCYIYIWQNREFF